MKKILISASMLVFLFGISLCFADDVSTTATATTVAKEEAPSQAAEAAVTEAPAATTEAKIPEGSCPEVGEHNALNAFHECMHPMHAALEESKYAEMRELYPKLKEASKGLVDYKCAMWDKCSQECKKDFETKKAGLLKSVDDLGESCKGEDNAKIEAAFAVMHDAYITFASKCAPAKPAETKAEETKVEETKAEETK